MGFPSLLCIGPSPRGDRPNNCLATVLDDNPLNPHHLRPLEEAAGAVASLRSGYALPA